MKKDIHPSNYREVVFKDMSNDEIFITRSTVATRETIKQKLVDTAGRVDKFMSRYAVRNKK